MQARSAAPTALGLQWVCTQLFVEELGTKVGYNINNEIYATLRSLVFLSSVGFYMQYTKDIHKRDEKYISVLSVLLSCRSGTQHTMLG